MMDYCKPYASIATQWGAHQSVIFAMPSAVAVGALARIQAGTDGITGTSTMAYPTSH
ncbi:hypothetical protein JNJ66_05010 [Candidatus Saccharibacteria bacterium]|nr:hypothetical protein [Candidatus Saccharibacteria bacterium]